MSAVPFVNLTRQLQALKPELLAAVEAVLDDQTFIQGPHLARFEAAFAEAHGLPHAVGCANGTVAISLALETLGVGRGDEVILPAHTFAATAAAVCHVGATPVFADIEPGGYGLDAADVAGRLTPRSKALIPVHLYGAPCRMDDIAEAVRGRPGIVVVEDCAQAHLARYQGRPVGAWSRAATFSFYPGKNLGACGDAGAILTADAVLADRLRKLRDHGRSGKYDHDVLGYNHRMDGIQAAILSVKLPYLATWTDHRRRVAARYDSALRPRGFKVVDPPAGSVPVYHLYVVEVANRDEVQAALRERGIGTGVHYPVPLHRQPAFAAYRGAGLPVTDRVVPRVISLPMCGELAEAEQGQVVEAFLAVARP